MNRWGRASAVCVASVSAWNAGPAAAEQPSVETVHLSGPAPALTAACGFTVTREVDVTIRTFSTPDSPAPLVSHAVVHATGTFTGPSGRSFTLTTSDNIRVLELADGTLVEVDSGRTLSFSGRVYDVGGPGQTVFGRDIDPTSYCDQLAP